MHYAGDAVLAKFDAVVDALSSAVSIQNELETRNEDLPNERKVQFRIGVNLGDVIEDRGDIYGDGVNVAARLESLADEGGICISESVRTAIGKKLDLDYESMGEQQVKNIEEPVRAYKVALDSKKKTRMTSSERPALQLPDKPSIAVLPFTNMSGDAEQEYFADGITEDIITALSNVQSFFVIARNSTFTYKGKAVDVKQVGRELGVHYVLEGSVRKVGNRVRVTAQLLNAGTASHIWADRYDGELSEIFDLQDKISASVVGAIEPHLTRAEAERIKQKRPESLDAYDYTLRGLSYMNKLTPEDSAEALRLFRKAIESDPSYGRAYVCASWCHRRQVQLRGMILSERDRKESVELANAALQVDPSDPYVLWQAGTTAAFVKRDFEAAIELIDRSLSINANSTRAWSASGIVRNMVGDPETAIDHANRAIRLSPLDISVWVPYGILAIAEMQQQQYEDAAAWARKSVRQHAFNVPGYHVLAACYAHLERLDDARAAIAQSLELDPKLTISRLKVIYPIDGYKNLDEFLDGLRKAGLPE